MIALNISIDGLDENIASSINKLSFLGVKKKSSDLIIWLSKSNGYIIVFSKPFATTVSSIIAQLPWKEFYLWNSF